MKPVPKFRGELYIIYITWLLYGIASIFSSCDSMILYAKGGFICFINSPNIILAQTFVVGGLCVFIGINLFISPLKKVYVIMILPFLLISFMFFWTVVYEIKYEYFRLYDFFLTSDYLLMLLAVLTIKVLRKAERIEDVSVKNLIQANKMKFALSILIFNTVIFLVKMGITNIIGYDI